MMSPTIKHYGERVQTTAWRLRSTTSDMVVVGFVASVVLPFVLLVLILVPMSFLYL
jgi:hypothetical protein